MNPYEVAQQLVKKYNKDPKKFTDEQGNKVAEIASYFGIKFKPESKALKKFAFDAADVALLGMIPNRLRPKTAGEDIFGESFGEELAGATGTLLGLIPPVALGAKAIGAGGAAFKGLMGKGKAGYTAGREGLKSRTGGLAGRAAGSRAGQMGSRAAQTVGNIGTFSANTIRMKIIKLKEILTTKRLSERARMNVINQIQRLINSLPQRIRRT